MNRPGLLILSLLSLFSLQLFAKDGGYNITVKIAGYPKHKLLLGYYYGDKQYIRDSAITDATGKAVFKGKEALDGGIYLIASEQKTLLFDLVVTEQEFTLETDTADYIGNMVVKGSPENVGFFNYSKFTNKAGKEAGKVDEQMKKMKGDSVETAKLRNQMNDIEQSVMDYRKKAMAETPNLLIAKIFKMMQEIKVPDAPKNPDGSIADSMFQYNYYKEHYFDNFDFTDDRIVRTPIFHPRFQNYITKVIPQIPDSIIKAADFVIAKAKGSKEITKWCIYWVTNYYETSQFMGMDAVFVHMAKKYYADKTVTYWVDETLRFKITDRADLLSNNLLGKKGKNINLPDSANIYQSMYNMTGDYTVLVFWDATCGRCKEEIPKLLDLYNEQNKDVKKSPKAKPVNKVDVYAVSMTTDPKLWKEYIQSHKLPWTNVHDPNHESTFRRDYDVYSTPVVYLLGKEKKIIAKRLTIEQLKEFIQNGITE
jgi:thiol-disulfide isomerase/thioredoxin